MSPSASPGPAAPASAASRSPSRSPSPGLTTLYPPPPASAARWTPANMARLAVLQAWHAARPQLDGWAALAPHERIAAQNDVLRAAAAEEGAAPAANGTSTPDDERLSSAVLGDEAPEVAWDVLAEMDAPRLDWIEQDGAYWTWGERWEITPPAPTLEGSGVPCLYDATEPDRRVSLQALLRTFLMAHLALVDALTHPPREYTAWQADEQAPGGQVAVLRSTAMDQWEHARSAIINMQHLVNELRPRQAREALKQTMRDQLDRRRAETALLRSRCAEVRQEIADVRTALGTVRVPGQDAAMADGSMRPV
ncbi:hypothetical protein FA09DRAFT_318243 [Tilletiopsis washingtonensis]|uniref:Mediator of RNA polymerase II transcription subunit 7 n=1 Tax=Tilletiopsis washingtonensis TaxID=58919 RepID=A0A316ZCP1_9BASI|nr:hypothetical protein FA09DRAFT_318243 [Tilletiopsis washingtonensis]PWN98055.1 hypothetical protein FA09DRAFT_318243 [Tilletiopsis washingtonensis]